MTRARKVSMTIRIDPLLRLRVAGAVNERRRVEHGYLTQSSYIEAAIESALVRDEERLNAGKEFRSRAPVRGRAPRWFRGR